MTPMNLPAMTSPQVNLLMSPPQMNTVMSSQMNHAMISPLNYATSPLNPAMTSAQMNPRPSMASAGLPPVVGNKVSPPPIDRTKLTTPEDVVEKNSNLLNKCKISTIAVRLAKEAYFGKEYMSYCTFRGIGRFPGLPEGDIKRMKAFLKSICIPRIVGSTVDFEAIYKSCAESIGQSCKTLRKQQLAGLPLE